MKLTVELVPSTTWFVNLRSILTRSEWDKVRKGRYKKAKNRCEVCGGQGPKWPVECHEVWHYNDNTKQQTLTGLVALCPDCHKVKHLGLALIKGWYDESVKHFCKINNLSQSEAEIYIAKVFDTHNYRSKFEWVVNTEWLNGELK